MSSGEKAPVTAGPTVGRIRLLEPLGHGGIGRVYVGFDEKLHRRVAVKCLRHDRFEASLRARWLQEAQLLSRLNHPNVCQIYDFVEGEDQDYLILELIEGKTLLQALEEGLDEGLKMDVAMAMARALVALHGEGIVHGDLKPENVMLTSDGEPAGRIKVVDFGIARTQETPPEKTPAGSTASGGFRVKGTPAFMSPEQAREEPLTPASDMYSLGLLLHLLFAGRPAHPSGLGEVQLLLRAARAATLPVEDLSSGLTALIERLKSPAPGARPSAFDTLEQLRFLRDAPGRRLRRRLMTAAVAALAVVAGVMSFQAYRIAQTARRAEAFAKLAVSRRLATEAQARRHGHLDQALLLALEAQRLADTLQSRSALVTTLSTSPRIRAILRAPDRVHRIAWSRDGQTLATGSRAVVWLWDVEKLRPAGELEVRTRGYVWSLALSGDGTQLAAGTLDGTVELFDFATGRRRGEPLSGEASPVGGLAWSGDGRELAILSGGTIRVWNVERRSVRYELRFRSFDPDVANLAWSGDGRFLASGDDNGTLRLWDAVTGRLRHEIGEAHADGVTSVAWSGDGRLLASGGRDHKIRIWDARTGVPRGAPLAGHEGWVTSVAFSPDGKLLASGSSDRKVRVWDVETGQDASPPLEGHDEGILMTVAWSGDGQTLASTSGDRTVLLWNVFPEMAQDEPLMGHKRWINDLAFDPRGRTLASLDDGGTLRLWNLADGASRRVRLPSSQAAALAYRGDGKVLAASFGAAIGLWDPSTDRLLGEPLLGHTGRVSCLSWSGDGTRLASSSDDGTIRLWDAEARQPLGPPLARYEAHAEAVAWHGQREVLASGSGDRTLRFWDTSSGEPLGPPHTDHQGPVLSLAWSHNGLLLASGSADHTLRLWDAGTLEPHGGPLLGAEAAIISLDWSPDDKLLASTGGDRTVLLWDARTGELLARLTGHEGTVTSVAWSSDGELLASSGTDQTILVRRLGGGPDAWRDRACRRAGRNLSREEWGLLVGTEVPYHLTCP